MKTVSELWEWAKEKAAEFLAANEKGGLTDAPDLVALAEWMENLYKEGRDDTIKEFQEKVSLCRTLNDVNGLYINAEDLGDGLHAMKGRVGKPQRENTERVVG